MFKINTFGDLAINLFLFTGLLYIYGNQSQTIMKLNAGAVIGLVGGLIGGSVGLAVAFIADPIMGGIMALVLTLMFYIMYRAFIKPSMDYKRLLKVGIRGTGTILSVSETGTRINNQPLCKIEMQVEIPGQPVYTATTKRVISYFQIAQFQAGSQFHIMVDPANNQKFQIVNKGDEGAANQLTSNASPQQLKELNEKLLEMEAENNRIRSVGIYSKAIVTKFTNMGVNINGNNPLATIEIQVLPENEPAFGAVAKNAIKNSSIPLFQPGEEIFVKYDPNDKTKVAIEHS